MRIRDHGAERGAISAEYVAAIVVVAAVVAALVSAAIPDRVEDAGVQAVDCLFAVDACESPGAAGDGDRDGDSANVVDAQRGGPVGDGPVGTAATASHPGPAARHEAEVARQLQAEARSLQELADRDLPGLAVWEELQDVRADLADPVSSVEDRDAALERYEDLLAQVEAAPDGSLLAELRDTDLVRGDPLRTYEDNQRLIAVAERIDRARHAEHLGDLLAGWAASDRRFAHVEVDLDDGTARVAEVVHGDLDTAEHVAVVVPGTGNDAGTFDGSTRRDAEALSEALELVPGGGEGVAVVACLCYAPPPGLAQAARSGHADAGGVDLARIIAGLPVGDAQVHALGHSYGSTALGRAVDREGLEVTSTISLGGPGFGSGIGSVDDLPDGAGRVWALRHEADPIDLAFMHGRNPDRADFGAYRADVGDGELERSDWKPYQFAAHSLYYNDLTSVRNLALVVSGQHERVTGYREGRP